MHIAIDIGGTKIEVGLYKGKELDSVVDSFVIPTSQSYITGREALFAKIATLLGGVTVESIGVACPGIIDVAGNIISQLTNLPDYSNKPLGAELKAAFNTKVFVMNDAVCSAIAEYVYGDIKQYGKVIYLIMGTGLGGSVIESSLGTVTVTPIEPGGMVVELDARSHNFSKAKGLLEAYAGGGSIEKHYKRKLADVPDDDKLWDEVTNYLTAGINNIGCLLKPEVVVIGGGIGYKRQHALSSVIEKIKPYDEFVTPPKVEFTKVAGNSSLAGALAANFIDNLILNT